MKEENNIKTLNELNKGACMGMDAIKYILEFNEDPKLKDYLEHQYTKYQSICKRITELSTKYDNGIPNETSTMNKAMTWYTIKLKTIKDNTSSKLAEILFQGFNMGIAEGIKILNHKEIDKEIKDVAKEYVTMQEESIEKLKEFL